jgi:UDP-3-O-[3-hydroxymyristoyl] N-acetylglucosamine deacetylase
MSILTQKTILKKISVEGIGIHSGLNVKLDILPSSPNSGIVFKRVDLKKNNIVIPNFKNVTDSTLCTTISNEYGVKVSTIEHLMAAFYGLSIDNAIVELDSQEVPILDGSAKNFVELIIEAGYRISDSPIKLIKVEKDVQVEEGSKFISINKSNVTMDIDFEIKYENSLIKTQRNKINILEDNLTDIFNSRTYCLYEDIKKLEALGLGKGGSLENAVIIKGNSILNDGGLRNEHEFVNHKILDCMGNLYLSGYKIIGSVLCSQGGHGLTNKLLNKLFSDKRNYSLIEIKGKNLPHSFVYTNYLKSIA